MPSGDFYSTLTASMISKRVVSILTEAKQAWLAHDHKKVFTWDSKSKAAKEGIEALWLSFNQEWWCESGKEIKCGDNGLQVVWEWQGNNCEGA